MIIELNLINYLKDRIVNYEKHIIRYESLSSFQIISLFDNISDDIINIYDSHFADN